MTFRSALTLSAIVAIAALPYACTRVESPFRLVHLCVNDTNGIVLLKRKLEAIASKHQLEFRDDSDAASRDLAVVGYDEGNGEKAKSVINYLGIRSDGMGFSATNLGLPAYQISLSFSHGSDPKEAARFADAVVAQLRQDWTVEDAPES